MQKTIRLPFPSRPSHFGKVTDLLVSLLAAKTDAQAETNNSPKNAPLFFMFFSIAQ